MKITFSLHKYSLLKRNKQEKKKQSIISYNTQLSLILISLTLTVVVGVPSCTFLLQEKRSSWHRERRRSEGSYCHTARGILLSWKC